MKRTRPGPHIWIKLSRAKMAKPHILRMSTNSRRKNEGGGSQKGEDQPVARFYFGNGNPHVGPMQTNKLERKSSREFIYLRVEGLEDFPLDTCSSFKYTKEGILKARN